MGQKRKRPRKDDPSRATSSQQPTGGTPRSLDAKLYQEPGITETSHPVISLYYRQVVTLRQYILQRIPRSSKARRRRIAAVSRSDAVNDGSVVAPRTSEQDLAELLDTTLIGVSEDISPTHCQERRKDFVAFTQAQAIPQGTDTGPMSVQSSLVDFVISCFFRRGSSVYGRLEHLLSHGYRHRSEWRQGPPSSIPNAEARYPNKNVEMLKQSLWTEVLALLGNNGDDIMLKLLFDCGIFTAVDAKKSIYCQISGMKDEADFLI
ncbi:telomerase reverse transcriptase [Aspergillus stella-maris]|uniref:telomerase reverse transcriptase n=1 Tax=Aspergillus stella-maris TaxID=1810926 RepID=UPI003CCD182F